MKRPSGGSGEYSPITDPALADLAFKEGVCWFGSECMHPANDQWVLPSTAWSPDEYFAPADWVASYDGSDGMPRPKSWAECADHVARGGVVEAWTGAYWQGLSVTADAFRERTSVFDSFYYRLTPTRDELVADLLELHQTLTED